MPIIKDWENKRAMEESLLSNEVLRFMHVDWIENGTAYVTLTIRDYPLEGVTLDKLIPMIELIRKESTSMIIRADMEGAGIINIDRFKSIVKIVSEVVEYTKEDNLLRQIQFIGTGFFFRMLYKPFSLAIPKYFRDMVVFL
jgi:hypothetical protein